MNEQPNQEMRAKLEARYDEYAERARELFEAGKDKSKEAMDGAMEKAREQLAAAGELTADQGEKFKQYLQRDLGLTAETMRRLGRDAYRRMEPARLKAGALSSLAKLLDTAGEALHSLSRKAEDAVICEAGQVTSAGTLTCAKCGHVLEFAKTSYVPPCPQCYGASFRKSY
jgi:Zinc-ribbon containing domain